MQISIDNILETKFDLFECGIELKKLVNKPVILYGAGSLGQLLADMCVDSGIQLLAVCDKNKKGHDFPYVGSIKCFEETINLHDEIQIIIASITYYEEIKNYVLQYVKEENIVDIKKIYSMMPLCYKLTSTSEYRKFINKNKNDIILLYNILEDDKSKETLKALLLVRLSWNQDYFKDIIEKDQYFSKDIIHLKKDEVFIDGGAFDGDTLRRFTEITNGEFEKIYCLEPGKEQFKGLIEQKAESKNSDRIILIQKALLECSKKVYFKLDGGSSRVVDNMSDSIEIEGTSIDELVDGKVSFIKMDIEGAELEALKGAEKTIKQYKPKLAICVYHKPEDIIEIPKYIASLNLGYQFYLRHYTDNMNETVLYAI